MVETIIIKRNVKKTRYDIQQEQALQASSQDISILLQGRRCVFVHRAGILPNCSINLFGSYGYDWLGVLGSILTLAPSRKFCLCVLSCCRIYPEYGYRSESTKLNVRLWFYSLVRVVNVRNNFHFEGLG